MVQQQDAELPSFKAIHSYILTAKDNTVFPWHVSFLKDAESYDPIAKSGMHILSLSASEKVRESEA